MITDSGIIIRTPASGVSTYSRTASGVIMMRLEEGQKIVNVTKTAKEEEKPEEENTESTEASVESENASVEEFVLETETKSEIEAPEVTEE